MATSTFVSQRAWALSRPGRRGTFARQAWHLATSSVTLRGRRGTCGRRHTIFHTPSLLRTFFHTIIVTHHLSHTTLSTPSFTDSLVTHTHTHTTLSHTIFHTQLCHTPSFTDSFITHHLSHTNFVTHLLRHTPSFTHSLIAHTIFHTHTTLPHTIFHTNTHTQLCHTQHCHTPTHTHHLSYVTLSHAHNNFVTHSSSHTFTYKFSTDRSSTTSFVYPSFPVPLELFVSAYWKKWTCGDIRSFNFFK